MQVSPADLDLMTRTVIGEADNQPPEGQAAVAHVILNRLASGKYGKTASDVVLAPKQFEPWQTKSQKLLSYDVNDPAYQRSAQIVNGAVAGDIPDPTGGATHFMNRDEVAKRNGGTVPQKWAQGDPLAVIGNHSFYAPGGAVAQASAPDLLGSWGKADAPQSAKPAEIMQPAPDILGAWQMAGPSADTAAKPAPVAAPQSRDGDPLPELARTLAGTQGDTWADTGKRAAGNVLQGVGDVANSLAQGIGATGDYGANQLAKLGVIAPATAAKVSDWRSRINSDISADNAAYTQTVGDDTAAGVGRIGGQLLGTAPALAVGSAAAAASKGLPLIQQIVSRAPQIVKSVLSGAGTGAGAAALTSASSDAPLSDQMATGGAVGGVLGPVGSLVSKAGAGLLGGTIDKATALLGQAARDKFGINVTAGQLSENPLTRMADSLLQRLPFTGYGARTAEQQSAFNRAVAGTFGENTDQVTTDTIRAAKARIGQVFEDVAQRTGNIHVDQPFVSAVSSIVSDARDVLGKDAEPILSQVRRVVDRVDRGTSTLSADSYQSLTSANTPLSRAQKSADPNIRYYAGQIREALDDMMQRSAPKDAVADLALARGQWKALKTVEPLAKESTTGDISVAKLLGKVNGNRFTSGSGGDLGELGRVGQRFLKEQPTSRTAENLLLMKLGGGAIAGAAGAGGAYEFDPEHFQRNMAIAGGTALAARGGSAVLRSNPLANLMIRNGISTRPNINIGSAVPNIAALSAPRTLPEPYAAQ